MTSCFHGGYNDDDSKDNYILSCRNRRKKVRVHECGFWFQICVWGGGVQLFVATTQSATYGIL